MRQRIIINSTSQEARVALLENDTLVEIHLERAQQRSVAGNIYKGKVARVLPGMQAAFVDIGLEKAGFIHASDLFGGPLPSGLFDDEEHDAMPADDVPEEEHANDVPLVTPPSSGRGRRSMGIGSEERSERGPRSSPSRVVPASRPPRSPRSPCCRRTAGRGSFDT